MNSEDTTPYKYEPVAILPYVYLGSERNASSKEVIMRKNIGYIINVGAECVNYFENEPQVIETENAIQYRSNRNNSISSTNSSVPTMSAAYSEPSPERLATSPLYNPLNLESALVEDKERLTPTMEHTASASPLKQEMHNFPPPIKLHPAPNKIKHHKQNPHYKKMKRNGLKLEISTSTESSPKSLPIVTEVESEGPLGKISDNLHNTLIESPYDSDTSSTVTAATPSIQTTLSPMMMTTNNPFVAPKYLKFHWSHDENNITRNFEEAYDFIEKAISNRKAVLIHCKQGISRSATLVVAYVMRKLNIPMNQAYEYVKSKSSNISPNLTLIYQLMEYDKELRGTRPGSPFPTAIMSPSSANMPSLQPLNPVREEEHNGYSKRGNPRPSQKKTMPASEETFRIDETNLPLEPKEMWKPKDISATKMDQFRLAVNKKYGLTLANYNELHIWSCENLSQFWSSVWETVGIIVSQPHMQVINENVPMDQIPNWFAGSRMNFAENLLRYRDDHLAIIATGESGFERRVTYAELFQMVEKCAAALRNCGVTVGDRIAGYIPNCVEAIVIMLSCASIGALWSSTSPDFGTTGVLDRLSQIKPKILFSVNAVVYNGKTYDHMGKLKSVVDGLEALEKVVVIEFVSGFQFDASTIPKCISFNDFLSAAPEEPLKFEQLPFSHPLYILYSSGTTGLPKCIVHSAGGTLIQHLKEHVIHGDITRDDVFFQYTTTGWMMWNWLVSALAIGCTIVLFDGSPFKPNNWILWELADKHKFTKFGTSAKYIQTMQEMGIAPITKYKLESLNEIYSTGSPLTPESFDFVYEKIKSDICLGSITGGTDIISLFAGHNHTLPVHRGEIQCRCLGMAVEAWSDNGKPVYGQSADLVCTKPFPAMPVMFWNDPNSAKYHDAYFSHFANFWYHGDYIWINPNTYGLVMLGRSDGTLKPAGVRFGSAEIYNIVEKFPDVKDSLAVGQRRPQDSDERVVLFLKMSPGKEFNQELVESIKTTIRNQLSPRHVPAFILPIADIPYTINGKKVEVAVKKIISGQSVEPSATLANPESLKLYESIEILRQ